MKICPDGRILQGRFDWLAELLKTDANEWRQLIKEIGFTAES
jgi:hypothetical protein